MSPQVATTKSVKTKGRKAIPRVEKITRIVPPAPVVKVDSRGRPHTQEKGGRPRIELSEAEIVQLKAWIQVGVPMEDCAAMLGIDRATLERHYMDVIKSVRVLRNAHLRRKQYEMAMSGNTGMLVWLGKQWLGQTDEMHFSAGEGGGAGAAVIELVFVDSDGDGHPKDPTILEGNKQLGSGR